MSALAALNMSTMWAVPSLTIQFRIPHLAASLALYLSFGFSPQPMETTMNLPYVGINSSLHLVYFSAMVS
ncbi:hypothetical protein TRIUR3_26951 [Triticum urartu]|uniref:Uncharacterized protein n=1 Tax=Triticum urartu TaxID=4572 RepID=M7YPK9_TRIUA|nr:hypothetical protein TRIUR3_26951 [Triticum urartu]